MSLSQRIACFFLLHALFLALPFGFVSLDRAMADDTPAVAEITDPAETLSGETLALAETR